ncbi:MAG: hypothetical protein KDA44_05190 [Planctomycetales bacterium]|nr:hypothetical protein [Planctomycetales bacterium]
MSQFYACRRTIAERGEAGSSRPVIVPAVGTEAAPRDTSIALELAAGCKVRFSGPLATEQPADFVVVQQSRCGR